LMNFTERVALWLCGVMSTQAVSSIKSFRMIETPLEPVLILGLGFIFLQRS
jgi:hypothetical protein